ncbi:MAG TPA: hypothetical protein DCR44_04855 [Acholeplasmatales bacterium]|nr:hypothetical protein [Acholeplasmatales bacterium]
MGKRVYCEEKYISIYLISVLIWSLTTKVYLLSYLLDPSVIHLVLVIVSALPLIGYAIRVAVLWQHPMTIDDDTLSAVFLPRRQKPQKTLFFWQIKIKTYAFSDITAVCQTNLDRFWKKFLTLEVRLLSGEMVLVLMSGFKDRQKTEIVDAIYSRVYSPQRSTILPQSIITSTEATAATN